jgi:hypothetical protein
MISFLKKEDDQGSKFMGRGDVIFLAVILALVGGFWYYAKTTKASSAAFFVQCDSLYSAQKFGEASACYEKASALSYLPDSLDSIIYTRTESISEMSENEVSLFNKADSAMARLDSASAFSMVKVLPQFHFLDTAKVSRLLAWQKIATAPKDTAGQAVPQK